MKINQLAVILGLGLFATSAMADSKPTAPTPSKEKAPTTKAGDKARVQVKPDFDCGVTINNASEGMVKVTLTNAATVDKTKSVIATIKTATGDTGAVFCGSAFEKEKSASMTFVLKASKDKAFIHTCTAKAETSDCPKIPK